jgi:hypothetical protein
MKSLLRKIALPPYLFAVTVVNRVGDRLETSLADRSDRPLPQAPVLILGAPRCGSTLLFQALAEAFDFGYLSNRHCQFYGVASWAERIFRPARARVASDYSSRHGVIEGPAAPSECGAFWYRFFPRRPEYVSLSLTSPPEMRRLRGAMRALGSAMGKPILFKNLHCSLRLEPTALALPEARFIVLRRDEIQNAHSVLETRLQVHGNYETWWSMEPPSIDALRNLPPHQQVVEQIRHIHATIDADRAAVGASRFIDVGYEEFCDDPTVVLERIATFLAREGIHVRARATPPAKFSRREIVTIDAEMYERLRQYVASTGAENYA